MADTIQIVSSALLGVFGRLLHFDNGEGGSVIVPQDVVGIADTGTRRLVEDFLFLGDLHRICAVYTYVPKGDGDEAVDKALPRFGLAETEYVCGGLRGFRRMSAFLAG